MGEVYETKGGQDMSNSIEKRQLKEKSLILENLRRIPIIEIACNKSGVGRASYYRWRKQDPEFAKGADDAYEEGTKLISDMAESQLLSAIKEGNLSAVFYWLNHRHPTYANKVEITTAFKKQEEILTPEQEELLKKALSLANLLPEQKVQESDQQENSPAPSKQNASVQQNMTINKESVPSAAEIIKALQDKRINREEGEQISKEGGDETG